MPNRIDVKAIRESKGITLDQVFEDTKIPKRVLVAIETGDFTDLFLSPVYVKGFAKSYARYLGIDPEELVAQLFPEGQEREEEKRENPPRSRLAKRNRAVEILQITLRRVKEVIAFVLAWILGLLVRVDRRVLTGVGVIILAFFFWLLIPHRSVHEVKQTPPEVSVPGEQTPSLPAREEEAKPVKEISAPEGEFSILVEASDDCWMRVKADGLEVFRGILKKGDVEEWSGEKEISLWVGNAGALKVTCGDKHYTHLGRKGEVVKEIVFLRDCTYEIRR